MLRALVLIAALSISLTVARADVTLFENVRVFDGVSPDLSQPVNVLVRDAVIERISSAPITVGQGEALTHIAGDGRTLMPGLIDAHTHLIMGAISLGELMRGEQNYVMLRAGVAAGEFLMRGFTTARDMGGPVFGLKQAIDTGVIPGPRVYPAGATISQTSGHGDFRMVSELPWSGGAHYTERFGYTAIADGVSDVLRSARENLMRGASQIKLMAGGGVASDFDPLDVTQYTTAEMRAAVEAAAGWNTYVTVHAYTPAAIRQAILAGVKSIEHGQLMDEDTARLMAEHDVWWSMQPFLDDDDANPLPEGSPNRLKQKMMRAGTDHAYALAKKYGLKLAWGTDTLFAPALAKRQGQQLTKMVRWFTPAEVLKMATHDNAQLLALSGARNPYPGVLGVVREGALADLLLVNGDVLADIGLLNDPARNLLVIMKNGAIYKDITGG